jgi:hypothetical protein
MCQVEKGVRNLFKVKGVGKVGKGVRNLFNSFIGREVIALG